MRSLKDGDWEEKRKTDKRARLAFGRRCIYAASLSTQMPLLSVRWPGTSDQPSLFALALQHDTTKHETRRSSNEAYPNVHTSVGRGKPYARTAKSNDLSNPSSQIYVVAGECERKSEAGHMKRA